jgi:hypothetical protein
MAPWRLFCQAVDHKNQCLGSFFHVYIATSAYIDQLKGEIFTKLPQEARKDVEHLNATDLRLWKPTRPISTTTNVIYKRFFANLQFPASESDDKNPDNVPEVELLLSPIQKISKCWDEEPPNTCVHVVVQIPRAIGTS